MAGVEAVRVLSVLDEAVDGLKLLSYLTPAVLKSSDQLVGVLGQSLADTIIKLKAALNLKTSKDETFHPDLVKAVTEVWRHMKRTPAVEAKLMSLDSERSDAFIHILSTFNELRSIAHKRLTTTVEEDNSAREHFEDVKLREEKAMSEKQQLQQKLKLDRTQWQKLLQLQQQQQEASTSQLHNLLAQHAADITSMNQGSKEQEAAFHSDYSKRKAELQAQVAAAEKTLAGLQAQHAEAEVGIWKAKKKGEQEVELAVREYDSEVAERHQELMQEQAAYDDLCARMKILQEELVEMKQERVAHEEELQRKRKELQRSLISGFMQKRAARSIQSHWAAYLQAKKKAAKEAAKSKGKGK